MIPNTMTQDKQEEMSLPTFDDELSYLDFHTKREVNIKDISPYSITIPLKYVQRKNVKPETMLYNLTKILNKNNISDIDYTAQNTLKRKSNAGHELKSLSNRFCDNIILYYLVPFNKDVNKNEYLSKFLAEYTSKIKRLLADHKINVTKKKYKVNI